jgi:hypothetical protein
MSLIPTRNLLSDNAPHTRLTNPEVAGTNALRVENTNALVTGWAIQIGATGNENSEVVVGTPSSGSITNAVTTYDHPADTPVYFIKYDQVVFERSTAGTTGTAAPITGGTVGYQADSETTVFDDTSGSASYGYRTYFRNSVLLVNSTESDWTTFAGHSFYSLGAIRERSKQKLWNATYLNDETIDNWANEWKDEMTNEAIQANEDYSLGTVSLAFGTDGLGTITTNDFSQLRRVWVTNNGIDKYQSTKMDINNFLPDETFTQTHPGHYFQGDNIIGFKPEGPGTADLVFYRFGTTMVNDTDELPLPMRPYTKSFTDYITGQALYKDQKYNEGDRYIAMANQGKANFLTNLSPRDKSSSTMINIVEPVGSDDFM